MWIELKLFIKRARKLFAPFPFTLPELILIALSTIILCACGTQPIALTVPFPNPPPCLTSDWQKLSTFVLLSQPDTTLETVLIKHAQESVYTLELEERLTCAREWAKEQLKLNQPEAKP